MSTSPIASEAVTLARRIVVAEEAVVGLGAQHRLERQRVDRDHAAQRAGHVDVHAGVEEA